MRHCTSRNSCADRTQDLALCYILPSDIKWRVFTLYIASYTLIVLAGNAHLFVLTIVG